MARCHLTRDDVYERVRQNGCTSFDDVAAIVMERSGEMSVMGPGPVDPDLLSSILGVGDRTSQRPPEAGAH